jgi:hypothetical protein
MTGEEIAEAGITGMDVEVKVAYLLASWLEGTLFGNTHPPLPPRRII